MKYFITGATGFVGSRVARQLREAGHEVTALVRAPFQAQALADLGVRLAEGDITNPQSMREPMSGADGVFHIAGWYKVGARDKRMAEAINVGGTRNVLMLMKELHIPRGVHISTLGVFGDTGGVLQDESYVYRGPHVSRYSETKWRAHHEVAMPMIRDGLPLIIAQPGVVYGPDDRSTLGQSLRLYLRGLLPLTPQKLAFCWTHVDDSARGLILAMDKGTPGETYILGGPACTLIDTYALAQKITGIPAPILHPSPGIMRLMAAFQTAVGAVIPMPEPFAGETLYYSAGATNLGSSAKAERELGWTYRPLEQGLRETLEYELHKMGKTVKPS